MRTKDADTVFRELGEMYSFLRKLQKSRMAGESDEAYDRRQRRIIEEQVNHSYPRDQRPPLPRRGSLGMPGMGNV